MAIAPTGRVSTCNGHASSTGTLPGVVAGEVQQLDRADLLVLQYPMWWHLPPAMLNGRFDRLLAYGEAYTSSKRFDNGRFAGKRAIHSLTVGTSRGTYDYDGRSGDIDLMLWPVNFSLAYVGYTVLASLSPTVSRPVFATRTKQVSQNGWHRSAPNSATCWHASTRVVSPFNRMAEWRENGRILLRAPDHSPFI
jgi:NAD(P)H dehydrogenase (quinone)